METAGDGLRAPCELPRGGELSFLLGVTQVPKGTELPGSAIAQIGAASVNELLTRPSRFPDLASATSPALAYLPVLFAYLVQRGADAIVVQDLFSFRSAVLEA